MTRIIGFNESVRMCYCHRGEVEMRFDEYCGVAHWTCGILNYSQSMILSSRASVRDGVLLA